MKECLIGIDIGTSGTKTGIFDTKGRLIASAFEESHLYYPKPDHVEQDMDEIYGSVMKTIKTAIKNADLEPKQIVAISIDGQMAGICGIDKNWKPVTHYDSWLDVRSKRYKDLMDENCGELVLKKTGVPPMVAGGTKMLWWKEEEPERFKRIHKFIQPAAYVAGRMAGLKGDEAFIDYTYLHLMGFSDVQKAVWCEELCDIFQMPMEKLPRVVKPWEIVGYLTREAARQCGLIDGIPIAAGAGDQAAGTLGAGIVKPGIVFDVAGTASIFSSCVDRFTPDTKYRTLIFSRSVIPELWYPLAFISGGGLCLRWFRDEFCEAEKATARRKKRDAYELLGELAEKIPPGSEGLIFVPHLGGRASPNEPDFKGLWHGFSWGHRKAHFYRSIMEGIAYEYSCYLKIQKELFPHIDFREVRVIGGGSKSYLWNQIKADVLGLPYVQIDRAECAILGSAIIAGYAIKLFDDLAETSMKFIKPVKRFEPRPEYHAYYEKFSSIYADILETNRKLFRKLTQVLTLPTPN